MRNIQYLLLLILFAACNKPAPRNNEITKIEFASMGYRFDGAAISIDSSLVYNYAVLDSTKSNYYNYYSGKITPAFWDTVNKKIEKLNYKHFEHFDTTEFHGPIIECCAYEMIITYKGGKKYTWQSKDDTSARLATFEWLNSTYKNVKLNPVTKPIKFETTFQNPPPMPSKDTIKFSKFPPPNKY